MPAPVAPASLRSLFNFRPLSAAELQTYAEQGYLVLSDLVKPAGLEQLVAESMAVWTAQKGPYDPAASWLQNALLPEIHRYSALVRDYYFRGPLVDIMEQLIGPNLKAATSQLTFKMRGNTKPFAWHQDNSYGELDPYNAVTCLTALEDNDLETGCLWLVPGSHHRGQLKIHTTEPDKTGKREVYVDVNEADAIPLPMKAGDCLIFSCWMLHKSEGNFSRDRDRRVLFFRYADADAVEVGNGRRPRLGRLIRGQTRFPEVSAYERDL